VLELLSHLVDKSLVMVDDQGDAVRYRLLETVRQYAAEQLEDAGETLAVRRRHAAWCLALAEGAAEAMDGPQEAGWLARLEQERDNLRAALSWSLEQGQRWGERERLAAATTALRLAGALPQYWARRGHLGEGRRWLARALMVAGEAPAADRARALHGAGILAYHQIDFAAAHALIAQSLALYRQLADERGIAEAQKNLGETALRQGDYVAARKLLEASLHRYEGQGDKQGLAALQYCLGELAFRQGDYAAAIARREASLALNREVGNTMGIANALAELALLLDEQGEAGPQAALLEESLALYREVGTKSGVARVLADLGLKAWARGEYEQALKQLQEGLALYREVDNRRGIARMLGRQGLVEYSRQDYARAAALCRESLALYRAAGDAWEIGRYLWILAAAAFGQGQPERAARLFAAAAAVRERLGARLPRVVRSTHDGAIAAVRATLGEPAFALAWAEGQALTPDAAIDS
jgi:tetratricopeptide (TPR) repeat protein